MLGWRTTGGGDGEGVENIALGRRVREGLLALMLVVPTGSTAGELAALPPDLAS
jgi:hypothetical protein